MDPLMQETALRIIGLVLSASIALVVLRDAHRLRDQGARLSPWAWAALTVGSCGTAIPVYLILRATAWQRQIDAKARRGHGGLVAGGTPELNLPCECGKRVPVAEASAGSVVQCSCGRTLQVPRLSELRRMAAEL